MVGEPEDVHVYTLAFDDWNEHHLAEHGVFRRDVEAVLADSPRFFRNRSGRAALM